MTAASTKLAPAAYDRLKEQVRDAVRGAAAPGAVVAVVSRGDDGLVRHEGREGWHFPRAATGRWIGYHPESSAEAIAHLESSRAAGADYLVIPATAYWWLEHYAGFARHLGERYPLVDGTNGACRIFRLSSGARPDRRAWSERGEGRSCALSPAAVRQLTTFLDAVLPPGAPVAVAVAPDQPPPDLPGRSVVPLIVPTGAGVGSDAADVRAAGARALEALVEARVAHVVVPRAGADVPPASIRPPARALPGLRLLAVREHLCALFVVADGEGAHSSRVDP